MDAEGPSAGKPLRSRAADRDAEDEPEPGPAEAELFRNFAERLRLFAVRRLGRAEDAEDVAQETLRRVVVALRADRVRNLQALPGFVFETARHLCQQQHRSMGRETRALRRLRPGGARAEGPPSFDPLAALVSARTRAHVNAALDRLAPADRDLLQRFFYHGEETPEVARALSITPAAVRVRKHRALQRLAELLDDADL